MTWKDAGVKSDSIQNEQQDYYTEISGVFTVAKIIQRDKSSGQIKLPARTSSDGIRIKRGAREERFQGEMQKYSFHHGAKTAVSYLVASEKYILIAFVPKI